MTARGKSRSALQSLVEVLRTELAWYPGRSALVARIVLACMSVVLIAVVFRIPGATLGASFPILISRENLKATRKTAFQIGLACSIGTAAVIVGGMLTAGSAFLQVMWVLVSLFGVFYAISSLNFSNASLTLGAVVALGIQTWDYPVSAEARVELTLYTLLSILLGCVVSTIIESILAKKNSPDAVLDGISRRLNLMKSLLSQTSAADFPSPTLTSQLTRAAAKGVDDLCELLVTSSYDAGFHDLLATVTALTRRLIELGATFVESAPELSSEDRERCRVTAQNLASVCSSLARMQPSEWVDLPLAGRASNPILVEIERTTALIAQSFGNESFRIQCCVLAGAPAVPASGPGAGAHSNSEHFTFAVRGTLSAFLCYVLYMGTGWLALAAPSLLTCALTARRLTGANRHRQNLRFAGFLVGAGLFGWGAEVFLLPQLNTIAEYALLYASVVWIGAWIATSGPRIAFSGFQIVLSFGLVNLNRFTINTSLVPARDKVLGVVLGVVAMWLVFDHLWAQASSASVRSLLLVTLRNVANLKAMPAESSQEAIQRLTAESTKINRDIDKLRDLADLYTFESFPKKPHESLINRSIRTLLPELRAFLLLKTGLMELRHFAVAEIDEVLMQKVEERASSVIHGLANAIERESPEQLTLWSVHNEELRWRVSTAETKSRASQDLKTNAEMRLCASLLELASDLDQRARLNFVSETGAARVNKDWSAGTIAET